MSDAISVPFELVPPSPLFKEPWPKETRTYRVAWDDRFQFYHEVLGHVGRIPMRHPDDHEWFASKIQITADPSEVTRPKHAIILVTFTKPTFGLAPSKAAGQG